MPYIEQPKRPPIDQLVDPLIDYLKTVPDDDLDGDLTYVFYKSLVRLYQPVRYRKITRVKGVLNHTKDEYDRRIAGPYEDTKIQQNGDVS